MLLAALVKLVSPVNPGVVGFLSSIGPYMRNSGPGPSCSITAFENLRDRILVTSRFIGLLLRL